MSKTPIKKKLKSSEAPTSESLAPLHVRLRPASLEEVIGQEPVVKSLTKLLGGTSIPHAFLFTGPSGCGKTTLARILAHSMGADSRNIIELDAATYSGVNEMRSLTGSLIYKGLGESTVKFVIVDECHALSKQTWQSLLINIEEPPEHVFWAFCTTESDKVPQTIKTRCHSYELKPVKKDLLEEYLEWVVSEQSMDVPEELFSLVADKSEGSVRQALVYLSAVEGVETRKEAYELLAQAEETPEVIDFVRKLVDGRGLTWKNCIDVLGALLEAGQAPESIRIVMVNYLAAVLMKTGDEKRAVRLLSLLDAFKEPYRPNEKAAPLLLSVGQVFFAE